jgi:hypothetical protein
VAQLTSAGALLVFTGALTAEDVINGRSQMRKNTHANATDSGVMINNEIVRMCSLVKPNQYQCMSISECVR